MTGSCQVPHPVMQPPALVDDAASSSAAEGLQDDDDDDVLGEGASEEWDDWAGEDEEEEATPSLFEPKLLLPSPEQAMKYDAEQHQFDLRKFIAQAKLTDYGVIQVINFIRSHVAKGTNPLPLLSEAGQSGQKPWESEQYLLPVLAEDPLLCYDYDEWTNASGADVAMQGQAEQAAGSSNTQAAGSAAAPNGTDLNQLVVENKALRNEVAQLKDALQLLRHTMLEVTGLMEAEQDQRSSSDSSDKDTVAVAANSSAAAATGSAAAAGVRPGTRKRGMRPGAVPSSEQQLIEDSYFDSYSSFNIHREMLSDKPRTEAYRDALERNPSLMKGSRVLDVGCGTGILSLFACRGGASQVVAVDGSERIAGFAKQICSAAGYSAAQGGPMHVVASKLEQLQQLPGGVTQVDVIVSEWMGYALLFETMLDSVLAARDKWLKPGGVVLPDIATIYLAGASSAAMGLDFWKDVYGFNMQPIADELKQAQACRANVLLVDAAHITTTTATAKVLDLCTMKPEDQDFSCEFALAACQGANTAVEVACIVLWFDTDFSAQRCSEHPVKLSTAPHAPSTHWAQTVLPLQQPVMLASDTHAGGQPQLCASQITGRLSMSRNKSKHRSLDISLEYKATLSDGSVAQHTSIYPMSVLGD